MMSQEMEIEHRILAFLRRKTNYYKYKPLLQEGFFQVEPTRQVFTLIDEYFKSNKESDSKLTISNLKLLVFQKIRNLELKNECVALVRSLRNYKTRDNEVVEEIIRDFARRQIVRKAILTGLEELDKPIPNFSLVYEHVEKAMMISTKGEKEFYSYFSDPDNRMEEDKTEDVIASTIEKLDQAMDGGWRKGELVIVLAPPERGKTLSLVNFGVAALYQGKRVGYITLEISERKIARRFDLRISGRPIELLRNDPGRIKNPLAALHKTGCDLVIKDYSAEDPHVEDIKSFIINYQNKTKKKFDLIIIDYIDLISPTRAHKTERFGIKEVYTNIRRMANELQVPILSASQANRKSVDKQVVTMEDFSEDFQKAAIADVILALCQTKDEFLENMCRVYVAKNRSTGRHPIIRLTMRTKTMFLGEFKNIIERVGRNKDKSVAERI
jgi:replicative DNA helicase